MTFLLWRTDETFLRHWAGRGCAGMRNTRPTVTTLACGQLASQAQRVVEHHASMVESTCHDWPQAIHECENQ